MLLFVFMFTLHDNTRVISLDMTGAAAADATSPVLPIINSLSSSAQSLGNDNTTVDQLPSTNLSFLPSRAPLELFFSVQQSACNTKSSTSRGIRRGNAK